MAHRTQVFAVIPRTSRKNNKINIMKLYPVIMSTIHLPSLHQVLCNNFWYNTTIYFVVVQNNRQCREIRFLLFKFLTKIKIFYVRSTFLKQNIHSRDHSRVPWNLLNSFFTTSEKVTLKRPNDYILAFQLRLLVSLIRLSLC